MAKLFFSDIGFKNLNNNQSSISWGISGYYELIDDLPVGFDTHAYDYNAEIIEEAELIWANDEEGNPYVVQCNKIGKIKIINPANVF